MLKYLEAIDELPQDIKKPFLKVFELFREEVAETVKRTDFEELKNIVTRLAQAQEELVEAQKKTEERLVRLEVAVGRLAISQRDIQRQVGGLSHTVGYTLENEAYKALPGILKERYNITVEGRLLRKFIEYPDGKEDEINIFGKGRVNEKALYIIGEVKTQLSIRQIEDFIKKAKRLDKFFPEEKFLLAVTHSARPTVIKHAEAEKIAVIHSYEF